MSPTIMVIENNLGQRKHLEKLLTGLGYSVESVDSGEKAIALLFPGKYDCLVVGYSLPGIDGIQTIRRIREFDEKAGIVIVTDGNKDKEKAENEIEGLDVWSVCEKPVTLAGIATKIEDACQFAHLSPKISMAFQQETEATREVRRSFKAETRFPAPKTERRTAK